MESRSPLIVDVKRFSLEDGSGIRTVVFFKGCPLHCAWCQNPEAQYPGPEISFSARECLRCGACLKACPKGAIDLELPGHILRQRCDACGECVRVCLGKGLSLIGSYYSTEELTEVILKDLSFYNHSGGGVTLSGGECTLYPDYLEALLKSLKSAGINVAIETSGYFCYDVFQNKIMPYVDTVYYDIKIADPETHKKYVGERNELILSNLLRILLEERIEVHPRIPLVKDITATKDNLSSIVSILYQAGAKDVSLLPYNPMGKEMAIKLGRPESYLPEDFMEANEEQKIRTLFDTILKEHRKVRSNK